MPERRLLESDRVDTRAPDAGLAAISAAFGAHAGAAAAGHPDHATQEGYKPPQPHAEPLVSPEDVWALDMPPGILNAAGTIDQPDWGPPTGYAWRLTEVTVTFLAGTTLVQFFKNAAAGRLLFQTAAAGLWEPSRAYLLYGERLVAVATGGGVRIDPSGERISLRYLPTYMA